MFRFVPGGTFAPCSYEYFVCFKYIDWVNVLTINPYGILATGWQYIYMAYATGIQGIQWVSGTYRGGQ